MNLSTHKFQKSLSEQIALTPDIVVLSGIKELDDLLGGFKSGEITFIDGDSDLISVLPNYICVNTYRMFGQDCLYIDGGLCADPYKIAQYARALEMDQKETLNHIHISRAFTVHQMSTLIFDMLEPIIKRYDPRTLIIGRFPTLYLDTDVKTEEAKTILKNNLEKLTELTKRYNLCTIFTNPDKKMLSTRRGVRSTIHSASNEIVKLNQREQSIKVSLVNARKDANILTFAKGQLCLQDFGMVI
jgi:RNase H-fold protein (predicted Holliday junction resolvase)